MENVTLFELYFLIVLNFELHNEILCHLCSNEISYEFSISFPKSGAYNRGGAYIKSYDLRGGAYNRGGAYFRAGLQSSAYGR